MLFSVAWLRLLISSILLLALSPLVHARDESLFTSSVTYCTPPESLLIQQFDVAYIAKNQSITFNISAASVEPNINVSANLLLNVYGMHPVNLTIDLCSILNGALCPLPMYNFSGSDSIRLPSSLGVSGKIPGVAFKIPDLEAFAQLTLVDKGTGVVKACVQSTLSNGWSMHQRGVQWSTGAFTLVALLTAIWPSISPDALAPHRLLDLLFLFQTIAATGFLNLNYPSVYRAFTLNFAWAMGLVSPAGSSLQSSIDKMRHLTGGNMANATSGSAVGLVNRKLSPYNVPSARIALASGPVPNLNSTLAKGLARLSSSATTGTPQTVTQASANILQAGIPIYVNSIRIATANAFMTVFFVMLILAAIFIAVFGIGYGCLLLMRRKKWHKQQVLIATDAYPSFVRAWTLRLFLAMLPPILTFSIYQWTLKDSWLTTLLAVVFFIGILAGVLYPAFLVIRIALRSTPLSLFVETSHISSYGPLYAQYRTPRYYLFLPLLFAAFARALCIGVARSNGEVQIYIMIAIEFLVLVALLVLRPFKNRGGAALAIYLATNRLVCTALMVAFLERFSLRAIPRVVIGIVIAVLFSVAVIVMFVNYLLFSLAWLRSLRSTATTVQSSTDDETLEKGEHSPNSLRASKDLFAEPRPTYLLDVHSANSPLPTLSFVPSPPPSSSHSQSGTPPRPTSHLPLADAPGRASLTDGHS